MLAISSKADIAGRDYDVRFVPKADPYGGGRMPVIRSSRAAKLASFDLHAGL
jgi:hypothetical protein